VTVKNKKFFSVLLLVSGSFLGYVLWRLLSPVEVIAVHQRNNFSDVLVKNFPFTDRGKISWWLKNKEILKTKYNIPQPASYGNFTIMFWSFGDGYKEEGKYDRLCFKDMKTKVNCIEKDAIFSVNNDSQNRIHFTVYDGDNYLLKENGEVVEYEYE